MSPRKRALTIAVALVGLAVIGVVGGTLAPRLIEAWHLRALESSDPESRRAALEALAGSSSPRVIARIVEVARSDVVLRPLAAVALSRNAPAGHEALLEALRGVSWRELSGVLDALETAGASPELALEIVALDLGERTPPRDRARRLSAHLPELTPALRAWIADPTRSVGARCLALQALALQGPSAAVALDDVRALAADTSTPLLVRAEAYETTERLLLRSGSPPIVLSSDGASGALGETVTVAVRASFERPVQSFLIGIGFDPRVAEPVAVDTSGTMAARLHPDGLVSHAQSPDVFVVGHLLTRTGDMAPIEPLDDTVLVSALLRIRSDAPVGEHPLNVATVTVLQLAGRALPARIEAFGPLVVTGVARVAAEGSPGETAPAAGEAAVTTAAARLECSPGDDGVAISWDGGAVMAALVDPASDAGSRRLWLRRNDDLLGQVDAQSGSFVDPLRTALFTEYRLETPAGAVVAAGRVNEFGGAFRFRGEIVTATPGQSGVAVRVLGENSVTVQGLSFGLRVPPELARIASLSQEGTAPDAAGMRSFMYQTHTLERGETVAGVLDTSPPFNVLPAGVEQHVATIVLDVAADVAAGTEIPLEFGPFGEPPGAQIYTVGGRSRPAALCHGAVLVGPSPLPPPTDVAAGQILERVTTDSGARLFVSRGVRIRWLPGDPSTLIEIERDGEPLAALPADRGELIDSTAGGGRLHYRLRAVVKTAQGTRRSFPVACDVP